MKKLHRKRGRALAAKATAKQRKLLAALPFRRAYEAELMAQGLRRRAELADARPERDEPPDPSELAEMFGEK